MCDFRVEHEEHGRKSKSLDYNWPITERVMFIARRINWLLSSTERTCVWHYVAQAYAPRIVGSQCTCSFSLADQYSCLVSKSTPRPWSQLIPTLHTRRVWSASEFVYFVNDRLKQKSKFHHQALIPIKRNNVVLFTTTTLITRHLRLEGQKLRRKMTGSKGRAAELECFALNDEHFGPSSWPSRSRRN